MTELPYIKGKGLDWLALLSMRQAPLPLDGKTCLPAADIPPRCCTGTVCTCISINETYK